jgi:glycosyltransferase involved in cell wall biosynthesis
MASSPREAPSRVVIGMPMYRGAEHVAEALESLLAQDYDRFALLAIDDASPDATYEIALRYAIADARVVVERNERRLGMIGNWQRVFEQARSRYGEFEYFAWASDNDLWHPRWLSALVAALDEVPPAVLAYPRATVLRPDGRRKESRRLFDSRNVEDAIERLGATVRGMRAGLMVYGLYRADALSATGVGMRVLAPDRALLTVLSLYGPFLQVPETLWTRRAKTAKGATRQAQRAALFAARPPLRTYLPLWLSHACWLAELLVVRDHRPQGMSRVRACRAVATYVAARVGQDAGRALERRRKEIRRWSRQRRKMLRASRRALRARLRGSLQRPEDGGSAR